MATAILSSRNSLTHQLDHQNPNSRFSRHSHAAATIPRRRKQRSPTKKTTVVESPAANTNLVMGQVKILKRGETLSSFQNKETNRDHDDDTTRRSDLRKKINGFDSVLVSSVKRLGPEPEIVQKQIGGFKGLRGYAGSNCSVSPPPSSVPIPKFLV